MDASCFNRYSSADISSSAFCSHLNASSFSPRTAYIHGHRSTRRERRFDNPPPLLLRPATSRPLTALNNSRISSSVRTQARSHHLSSFPCRPAIGPGGFHRTLAHRDLSPWDQGGFTCAPARPAPPHDHARAPAQSASAAPEAGFLQPAPGGGCENLASLKARPYQP